MDGPAYAISEFNLVYAAEHPDRPSIEELKSLSFRLGRIGDVFVAPRPGVESVELNIEDLMTTRRATRLFSVSALNSIGGAIVAELNRRGLIGVVVAPDPQQVDFQTLQDLRAGPGPMTLFGWTRTVQSVRTVGDGKRWERPTAPRNNPSQANRINNPRHQRIRDNSPLQPGVGDQSGDLLRKDALDAYLFRLNRHDGRRVDAAIAAGDQPGEVVLDYIVTENRPWTAYAQISNTGTRQTSQWRQRFGFVHNQLTNRDDTLAVDYVTAGFTNKANGLTLSYEAPLGRAERLRYRVYGSFSNFTASDVGFADEEFKGEQWGAGGELIWNAWQRRMAFVDVYGGLRWGRIDVKNEVVDLQGKTNVYVPYIGARFERETMKASTLADVRIEFGSAGSSTEVLKLGRLNPDDNWAVLKWNASQSFYLEPLLLGAAWEDPATPDRKVTLAHEVALSLRGQSALGNRLIPQEQEVVGGLYSVRGYRESATAGDTVVIASAEYRFHLPRAWQIEPDPSRTTLFGKPFRFAPQQRYGFPDWDLILKGFVDVGRSVNTDRAPFERDETMVGVGPGIELVFRRNVSVRADWGFALRDAGGSKSGDNRVSFVATIVY
ncbi:hypothetical protein J4558_14455 [Leptolyngbya sp. 15MV]|nr:hypothetical protein J4558_14455 [Leptolyngbya sp. 15MV]